MRSTRCAGEDAGEARVLALEVLVAHERAHVLADDLLARVAEQAHGARVPVRDPPFAVGADDRVVGRLDDRGHQLGGGLGAAQVGHVAIGHEDAVAQLHRPHLEDPGQMAAAHDAVEGHLLLPRRARLDHLAVGVERASVAEGGHEVQQPVVDDVRRCASR